MVSVTKVLVGLFFRRSGDLFLVLGTAFFFKAGFNPRCLQLGAKFFCYCLRKKTGLSLHFFEITVENICIIVSMRHEAIKPILKQLRVKLESLLGDQMEAMYLYGSQARNEAQADSDIDVLVVLRGDFQYFDMVQRTGGIVATLSLNYDTVISLAFISSEKFSQQQTPFILNVKQEGIVV